MDTFIWGPPTWKLLHTLSFADPDLLIRHAPVVTTFLTSLQHVLPCVYCRDSYAEFMKELPALDVVIRERGLARWMYDMHAKVTAKLGGLTPEFARVHKRFAMRPIQWCPRDVWDMITLFGMNFSDEKREGYRVWWDSLQHILPLAGAEASDIRTFQSLACPGGCNEFMVVSTILSEDSDDRPPPTCQVVVDRAGRFDLARAGLCRDGVCK
mgnify:CR=1 FL=1